MHSKGKAPKASKITSCKSEHKVQKTARSMEAEPESDEEEPLPAEEDIFPTISDTEDFYVNNDEERRRQISRKWRTEWHLSEVGGNTSQLAITKTDN